MSEAKHTVHTVHASTQPCPLTKQPCDCPGACPLQQVATAPVLSEPVGSSSLGRAQQR